MTTQGPSDNPTRTAAWEQLARLAVGLAGATIRDLGDADPDRVNALSRVAAGIHLDASRQRVDGRVVDALLALAQERGVLERRDEMLSGAHINVTEDRAVLHTALRRPASDALNVDGQDVVAEVHGVLERMGVFAEDVRSGAWTGATGKRMLAVVNIGIGGSDLGPGYGVHGPAPLQRSVRDVPLRVERRPDGPVRGDRRPRSRRPPFSSSHPRPSPLRRQ